MIQLSNTNFDFEYLYLDNSCPTLFGSKKDCFDMHTLSYRVFGGIWKLIDGKRIILGYWFADNESELQYAIRSAGFTELINSDNGEINEVYHSIRIEQDQQNWSNRSKLPILSILKKPWKDLRKGWYVLKSGTNFPCILTCIQKNRYSVWIEHIQVCENKNDAVKFINLINTEHNIHLNYDVYAESNIKN
ncbi:hypothetical protein [Neobacillus sp. LXY-1]|uniref:hypothetical protein n=1 Tax=Neobacillus sp. LXY-1 TaxID=3379133 RepID=UPI003EE0F30E